MYRMSKEKQPHNHTKRCAIQQYCCANCFTVFRQGGSEQILLCSCYTILFVFASSYYANLIAAATSIAVFCSHHIIDGRTVTDRF